jgi:hypothetical protein
MLSPSMMLGHREAVIVDSYAAADDSLAQRLEDVG